MTTGTHRDTSDPGQGHIQNQCAPALFDLPPAQTPAQGHKGTHFPQNSPTRARTGERYAPEGALCVPTVPAATPAWLTAYTTRTGLPDPRRLGRNARPRTCPNCGRLTLTGADHHRIAAYPTVDPHPLTPAQEAAAILLAVATYELAGEPPTWELHPRTFPGVPTWPLKPANSCRVVAAHSCNRPPLSTTPLTTRARTTQFATTGERPPY